MRFGARQNSRKCRCSDAGRRGWRSLLAPFLQLANVIFPSLLRNSYVTSKTVFCRIGIGVGYDAYIGDYAVMVFKWWATRKLRSGDLSALAQVANGGQKPREVSVERLSLRRFVAVQPSGEVSVTLRGHVALMIRRAM
jgi:hypothetical protein